MDAREFSANVCKL